MWKKSPSSGKESLYHQFLVGTNGRRYGCRHWLNGSTICAKMKNDGGIRRRTVRSPDHELEFGAASLVLDDWFCESEGLHSGIR
jgi:hypothetical protein